MFNLFVLYCIFAKELLHWQYLFVKCFSNYRERFSTLKQMFSVLAD